MLTLPARKSGSKWTCDGFRDAVAGLADGDYVISVAPKKAKRSIDQNEWLWGVALKLIAEHCGYDEHERDDLHYDLLAERYGTREVESRVSGVTFVRPARTSSELNTKEFSEYMEWLVRFAAQKFGVVIPLPGESYA